MIIERIIKNNLCIGCGLCSSVLGSENCKMSLGEKGFYLPKIQSGLSGDAVIRKLCPGIKVHCKKHKGVWGNIVELVEGWSSDSLIRYKAASGGIVTSLAIYLLEHHLVDGVLQVGRVENHYLYNEMKISRDRADVLKNAQSRYAPALTLSDIVQILEKDMSVYAFVGKPCDVTGLKNLIDCFPQYKSRFKIFISIFCAGMPSYNASVDTWKLSGRKDTPASLRYRGEGWPGNFKAEWRDGGSFELSYNDSWGKILGRQLGFRCKICPDGIGMLADIAVGDSWNTKNGYPDFTESEGRCFVFVRSDAGRQLMESAKVDGYIEYHPLPIDKIREMQAYQFERRKIVGWRILPVKVFVPFLLNFKGLDITKQALQANLKMGFMNTVGTAKRFLHIKWEAAKE